MKDEAAKRARRSGALPALEDLYLDNTPASDVAIDAVFEARPGL